MTAVESMNTGSLPESSHPGLTRTRLLPPRVGPRDLVRDRLLAGLHARRPRPLTVVIAPSGYGKTTLLGQWAAQRGGQIAWVSLDEADDQPALLAMALIAAIGQWRPDVGHGGLALLAANQKADPRGVGAAIAEDLTASGEAMAIVLDDAHVLAAPGCWALLAGLVAAAPPSTHIVIGSRRPLPLDLGDARDAGRLIELQGADLRFTAAEALDLAERVGVGGVAPALIELRFSQCGGWPALLRMLLVRLDFAPTSGFANDAVELVDRLVDLALSGVSPATREAALWSSIVPDLQDGLLATVVPPEAVVAGTVGIDGLAAIGLPMTRLGGDGGWVRIHTLVAESLARGLRREMSIDAIAAAYARASKWHLERGERQEAVRLALAGGDVDTAVEIVAIAGFASLQNERWIEMAALIDLLPDAVIETHPVVAAIGVWQAYRASFDTLGDAIGRFNRACAAGTPEDPRWPLRRLRAIVEVPATFGFYDPPTLEHPRQRAAQLLADLWEEDQAARGLILSATGFIVGTLEDPAVGAAYLVDGLGACAPDHPVERVIILEGLALIDDLHGLPYDDIDRRLTEALEIARAERLDLSGAFAAAWLGWSALHRVDLDRARQCFAEATAKDLHAAANLWRQIIFGQALVAAFDGRPDQAMATVDRARLLLTRHNTYDWATNAAAFRARIALLIGRPAVAEEWLESIPVAVGDVNPGLHEALDLTRARVLLAQPSVERIARANEALNRLGAQAVNLRIAKLRDPILVCRARALDAAGDRAAAVATIAPALASMAARGDLLTLVEHGNALGRVVAECQSQGMELAFLADVAAAQHRIELAKVTPPGISQNEHRILEALAEGADFVQIAQALGVSVNEARLAVRRLFVSLRVAGRTEAVAEARARGFLPRD